MPTRKVGTYHEAMIYFGDPFWTPRNSGPWKKTRSSVQNAMYPPATSIPLGFCSRRVAHRWYWDA